MGLKYSVNYVVKRFAVIPGFAVPFREQRQSRFGLILKDPRIFRMVTEHWLQVTSCITPN